MLFWKGWRSLNRNESRNNNGYGHTSKLYAIMQACAWIKESKGRGRLSAVSIQAIPRVKDLHLLTGDSYKFPQLHLKRLHSDYTISSSRKGGGCKALLAAGQGSSLLAWPTGNGWLRFTVHSSSLLLSKGVAVFPASIFRWEDQRGLIHKNALCSSPVNQRLLHSFFFFYLFLLLFLI